MHEKARHRPDLSQWRYALFKTPNQHYLFSSDQSRLHPLSAEAYDFLASPDSWDKEGALPKDLEQLWQAGLLSEHSPVQVLQHSAVPMLPYFLDRKLRSLLLQVTQRCNFRCSYCIYSEDAQQGQRSHANKDLSWERAKQAIDFFYRHSIDSERVNIGFYGGEPLLAFERIQQIVSYSRKRFLGKTLHFSMTSNGSLLNEETIRFLEANDVALMISFDGPQPIHDLGRVFPDGSGTYSTVMQGIAKLKALAPEYHKQLRISMVVDPQNDFDCLQELCFTEAHLEKMNVQASLVDQSYDGKALPIAEEYAWKYNYHSFLSLLSHFGRYDKDKVSPITMGVGQSLRDTQLLFEQAGPLRRIDAPGGPCVPGQMRLFMNVDGHFLPCERVSESSRCMHIGHIDTGLDRKAIEEMLNISRLTPEACKSCWAFKLCSLCVQKADDYTGVLSADAKLRHCDESRSNAYQRIATYLLVKEASRYYPEQISPGKEPCA